MVGFETSLSVISETSVLSVLRTNHRQAAAKPPPSRRQAAAKPPPSRRQAAAKPPLQSRHSGWLVAEGSTAEHRAAHVADSAPHLFEDAKAFLGDLAKDIRFDESRLAEVALVTNDDLPF